MPKFPLVVSLMFFCITPALAGGKHEHGVGQMDVVVDGDLLTVSLELPLATLVGFERAPRNAKEKEALQAASQLLKAGAVSPAPSSGPGCSVTGVEVKPPFVDGTPPGEHADFDVEYRFRCATPGALVGVDTTLFKSFPRLYRLEVQRIGPKGQGGGRLTPNNPVLRW